MKVSIIGCHGYMGSHLRATLSEQGIEVVGFSSTDGSGVDPESGLFGNSFTLPPGVNTVVYMAQSPRYRAVPDQASHVMAVNTLSAVRAAIVARASNATRFIYISTGTVYAPTFSPILEHSPVRRDNWYSLSKLHAEEGLALLSRDMEVIVVRPFGVYGPKQTGRLVPNLVRSIRSGTPINLQANPKNVSDRDGLKISLCFIDDAIDIIQRLVLHGGPSFLNLAGDEQLSIRDMAIKIGEQLGINPKFEFSEHARDTNLVADISELRKFFTQDFIRFDEGINRVLQEGLSS